MRAPAPAPESYPFSGHWENAAGVRVLVLRGRVDALSAPDLSASICAVGGEHVIVDLGGVDSIDPGALRDVLLAARVVGIGLHVVCLRAATVHSAFRLARLVGSVSLHESRTEAVSAATACTSRAGTLPVAL